MVLEILSMTTNLEDNEAEKRRKDRAARRVLHNVVKKSLTQLYYETRITAVCWYYAKVKKEKVTRPEVKEIKLAEAQYVAVIHLLLFYYCCLYMLLSALHEF
jgi:hypothetical protein